METASTSDRTYAKIGCGSSVETSCLRVPMAMSAELPEMNAPPLAASVTLRLERLASVLGTAYETLACASRVLRAAAKSPSPAPMQVSVLITEAGVNLRTDPTAGLETHLSVISRGLRPRSATVANRRPAPMQVSVHPTAPGASLWADPIAGLEMHLSAICRDRSSLSDTVVSPWHAPTPESVLTTEAGVNL
jgi:hypothetical protein